MARVGEKKSAYMVTVGTCKGNRPLRRAWCQWDDNPCDQCHDSTTNLQSSFCVWSNLGNSILPVPLTARSKYKYCLLSPGIVGYIRSRGKDFHPLLSPYSVVYFDTCEVGTSSTDTDENLSNLLTFR